MVMVMHPEPAMDPPTGGRAAGHPVPSEARPTDTRTLLVVSVIDPGSLKLPGGRYRARVDQVRERREQLAQLLVERGREEGLAVSFLVWTGDPGDMIIE